MPVFGPVPSRRLGFSLGINHIPPKHCSYSCVYCQVGRTNALEVEPSSFFSVDEIINDVELKLEQCSDAKQTVDYLTLVPEGEPALDSNLKSLITTLKRLHYPVAVISNASLIHRKEIQEAFATADWISLKLDSTNETVWRKINRPHPKLNFKSILNGIMEFKNQFQGKLVTETMLVEGINDGNEQIKDVLSFLKTLKPSRAYFSIPLRPPAEFWVKPPSFEKIIQIQKYILGQIDFAKFLFEPEDLLFTSTGEYQKDILDLVSVHPMREQALRCMVQKAGEKWDVVENLVSQGRLQRKIYQNDVFYCLQKGSRINRSD